jgi:hypothetical protein
LARFTIRATSGSTRLPEFFYGQQRVIMPRERAAPASDPSAFRASLRGFVLPKMHASAACAGEASRSAKPDRARSA